jgi:hypothetical protein
VTPPQSVASLLWRQPLVKGLVIALAYCLSGKAGLLLAIPPGYATAIWPASGIALVAMLVAGNRYWPAILAGSFLTNVTVATEGVVLTREVLTAIAIGCGASAQAVIGATLIRRYVGFPTLLANARDVFKFALLGGPLACLVAPTWGVSVLTATHTIPPSAYTYSWWTWWIGDTIGVLIITPLGVMWADRSDAWQSRRRIVTLSHAITFIAAILVFLYASRSEWRSLEADFNDSARRMATALRRRVELHSENLGSVANFFAASDKVERAEFQRFTRSIVTARGDVMGLGWIPRVPNEQRAALEASLPASAKRPYFYEMFDPWSRSVSRDETFPVLYFVPRTHIDISGFDLASEPVRRSVLEQARDTGALTASPRLEMTLAPGQPSDGFLLVQPIYDVENPIDIEERRGHLRGFAVEFFRPVSSSATRTSQHRRKRACGSPSMT